MTEREESQGQLERYFEYLNKGRRDKSIQAYHLVGDIRGEVDYAELLGVIPGHKAMPDEFFHLGSPNPTDKIQLYSRLRGLAYPIQPFADNALLTQITDSSLGQQHLPSLGIARGKNASSGEEVLSMFTIHGRSSFTTLEVLQRHIKIAQDRFN